MLALHGTWLPLGAGEPGYFFVWGETNSAWETTFKGKQHPYCAAGEALAGGLNKLITESNGEQVVAPEIAEAAGYLPSGDSDPWPSPDFQPFWSIGDCLHGLQAGVTDPGGLALWRIPGIKLPAWQAVMIFASLDAGSAATDVLLGTDLQFWQRVCQFVLELLARQRYLPVMLRDEEEDNSLVAAWRPELSGHDLERFEVLVRTMPPVCRALVWDSELGTGQLVEPAALLTGFLHQAVDATVRRWLPGMSPARGGYRRKHEGAGRWWVQNLTALEPWSLARAGFTVDPDEAYADWQNWNNPSQPETGCTQPAVLRACFRLEEPESQGDKQDGFILRFFLQAQEDQTLLIPAAAIWQEKAEVLPLLNHRYQDLQGTLLAGLFKAARLFPPLERSLGAPCPEACALTAGEAYEFLRAGAILFREAGFGVFLPSWWGQGGSRVGVRLRLKSAISPASAAAGPGYFNLDSLVKFDWTIAVGDVELEPEDFTRLVALKAPLIKMRGQWVEVNPEQVRKALNYWQGNRARAGFTLGEMLRVGLGPGDEVTGLPVVSLASEGPLAGFFAQLQGEQQMPLLPTPPGFCGQLRPYQERGFSWLSFLAGYGLGACLADDMGLGKTIQLLAWLLHFRAGGWLAGPVLLICPTSVAGSWQRETARFAPGLRTMVHQGPGRLKGEEFIQAAREQDLVISTYALAHRDLETLDQHRWSALVLDEAQNIKNYGSGQAQAIRRLRGQYRIALTGTPVENRLSELWSIMEFLNPGYLGPASEFRRRFIIPVERYRDQELAGKLRQMMQPFLLRRLKSDPLVITDLPAKQETKVYCLLTREQAALYGAVVQDMLARIDRAEGIERRGLVLATLTRLKQICNHPAQYMADSSAIAERSGKLTRLVEMLEEVRAAGDRTLIFTQFAAMGHLLRRYLQELFGTEALFLHGGVPALQRDELVRRFQEEEKASSPFLFILSLRAGGAGLNLTRANHVFHYDRWWNPAVENQATDRAYRIGQKRNVQVYKFIATGTLEERIDRMLEEKQDLATRIVSSGEAWLTEMSTADLRQLLAPDWGALAGE